MKKLFIMFALIGAVALIATSCGGKCTYDKDKDCYCKENPNDPRCEDESGDCTFEADPVCFCEENPGDPRCEGEVTGGLPDSILNGSNFYIIALDAQSTAALGNKVIVPGMLNYIDVWTAGETFEGIEAIGRNSWGLTEEWAIKFRGTDNGWAGGAIGIDLTEYETVPDLTPLMEGGYYFHYAVKAPSNQPGSAWGFNFYSEGENCVHTFGTGAPESKYEFPHDGAWHHFEIPVEELMAKTWGWNGPMTNGVKPFDGGANRGYIISFEWGYAAGAYIAGQELHVDAMFFYKKPAK